MYFYSDKCPQTSKNLICIWYVQSIFPLCESLSQVFVKDEFCTKTFIDDDDDGVHKNPALLSELNLSFQDLSQGNQ